jgi:hypothetical protein
MNRDRTQPVDTPDASLLFGDSMNSGSAKGCWQAGPSTLNRAATMQQCHSMCLSAIFGWQFCFRGLEILPEFTQFAYPPLGERARHPSFVGKSVTRQHKSDPP